MGLTQNVGRLSMIVIGRAIRHELYALSITSELLCAGGILFLQLQKIKLITITLLLYSFFGVGQKDPLFCFFNINKLQFII